MGLNSINKCISVLFFFVFLFLLLTNVSFAEDKLGIIIITDSADNANHSLALDLESYMVKLRDQNVDLGKMADGVLWVKTYDYNVGAHAQFINSDIKIPRNQAPFLGIAYLNPDRSFKSFVPNMKIGNITNPVELTREAFEEISKILYPGERDRLITKLSGFKLLESLPSDASVYVDDKLMGTTPLKTLLILPGEHEIAIKKEGYEEYREKGTQKEGLFKEGKIRLELKKGTIEVSSTPSGADVIVNNVKQGETPVTVKLSPGTHILDIKKLGYKDTQKEVQISSTSHLKEEFTLEPDKVKCYLDVRGYFAKIKVPNGSGGEEEKTFIIDQSELSRKMRELLEKQPLVELVPKKNDARVYILYEVVPQSKMQFKLSISDNKRAIPAFNNLLTGNLPVTASNEQLVDISVNVFEKKYLNVLNDILLKVKSNR